MSEIQLLKAQLHQVSNDARTAAGGLAGFKTKFTQSSAHVQALIAGTATGTDRDISALLDAAGKALDHAVQALEVASSGCRTYADQI
ncbi:hypothetical protein GCM10029976_092940 [Kribbella albertanoniae]|uniref:Uncharacterized protein n=1 Tax=Kribbella albertanoniae TaxID=1266829 RepID=A0A4R4QDJ2_9ACTN|nr:hypothetical protein [Kribbella albertanoniae]TDC33162.1 hypothetical protein E1261_06640 [Kribbella albertanoniae]